MADHNEIQAVKATHTAVLMARPNVVGVGIGRRKVGGVHTDERCLSVLVANKIAVEGLAPEAMVPSQLGSVPTDVVEIGTIWSNQVPTGKFRPAPGGVSIGHYQISAGTLGAIVRDLGLSSLTITFWQIVMTLRLVIQSSSPAARTAAAWQTTSLPDWSVFVSLILVQRQAPTVVLPLLTLVLVTLLPTYLAPAIALAFSKPIPKPSI